MILTQTNIAFPLSSVKPLDGVRKYRADCVEATKKAIQNDIRKREHSPITGRPLISTGSVEGLRYGCCSETGSLFLQDVSKNPTVWKQLLSDVNRRRQSPEGFHSEVAGSRTENVYIPKLDWIQSTLQMQEVRKPTLLEVTTPPSRFTSLLKSSRVFRDVTCTNEMDLVLEEIKTQPKVDAAVLLESLDRVDDPQKLLRAVYDRLVPGGLIFLTALVASGFDMVLLGFQNLYFCPPDRTNCFSLEGLKKFLKNTGFELLEVSTPGVLDVEIVQAHIKNQVKLQLSPFENEILASEVDVSKAFQQFLQQGGLSSFARIVGRKR